MNSGIEYELSGTKYAFIRLALGLCGALAGAGFVGYQAGKYNGINQGREIVMEALKDQSRSRFEDAKNSGSIEDKKRLLIESDTLNVVISDLEKISLEAEEIAGQ